MRFVAKVCTLEFVVVPGKPHSPCAIDVIHGLSVENPRNKISLHKLPKPFNLPFTLGGRSPDELDAHLFGIPLVISQSESSSCFVLNPFILEHLGGDTTGRERLEPYRKHIHLSLGFKPLPGRDKSAVIIQCGN